MRTCSCHAVSAISPARGCCVSAQSKTIKQHEIRESISVRGNRGAVCLLGVQSAGQGGLEGGQSRRTLLSSSASSAPAETLLGAQLLISVWMQRLVPTCVRITEFRCSYHPRSVRTVKHLSGSSDERARLWAHLSVSAEAFTTPTSASVASRWVRTSATRRECSTNTLSSSHSVLRLSSCTCRIVDERAN